MVPCDQRFLSCMAFSIHKVVLITCYSHSFVLFCLFCPGRKSCGQLLVVSVEPAPNRSLIIMEIMTQISSHERNHNAVKLQEKVSCGLCFAQQISLFDWLKTVINPVNHVSTSKILESMLIGNYYMWLSAEVFPLA